MEHKVPLSDDNSNLSGALNYRLANTGARLTKLSVSQPSMTETAIGLIKCNCRMMKRANSMLCEASCGDNIVMKCVQPMTIQFQQNESMIRELATHDKRFRKGLNYRYASSYIRFRTLFAHLNALRTGHCWKHVRRIVSTASAQNENRQRRNFVGKRNETAHSLVAARIARNCRLESIRCGHLSCRQEFGKI